MSELGRLRGAVEQGLPDTVAFLRELVRVPSLLGDEEGAQALVEARLRELGFDVVSVEPDAGRLAALPESGLPLLPYGGRRCLVGTLPGGGGRSLVLNGHVDVVSEEPRERWTRPPFEAVVEGDRLYGRGAADMKGGIAAMLLAVEAALSQGSLPGRVVYQSVIEEECTGNGALAACLAGPPGDAALIAEPTAGDGEVAGVGVIWARVTLVAPSGHAQSADERPNPIEAAFGAIEGLRALERRLNADPDPELAGLAQPYLLNVGALHAGDWPSTSPGKAELDVRLGFPIRLEPADAQELLREAVLRADPEATVEFRGFRARGYSFDPESPFVRLLRTCHEEVYGVPARVTAGRATTDLRSFQAPLGPGAGACYGPAGSGSHAVDEWVDLPSIADTATVIALLLRRWGSGT